jgi:hypothetical protein
MVLDPEIGVEVHVLDLLVPCAGDILAGVTP